MKICIKCDKKFNDDYIFCPFCRNELQNDLDDIKDTNQISIYELMENEEESEISEGEISSTNMENTKKIDDLLNIKNKNKSNTLSKKTLSIKKLTALIAILLLITATISIANILHASRKIGVQSSKENVTNSKKNLPLASKNNTNNSEVKAYDVNKNVSTNVNTNNSSNSKDTVVNTKKNTDLQDSIKNITTENFSNITSDYSLAFKDLSSIDTLSINSTKTISASTIKIYIMIEAFNQAKLGNINLDDTIVLEENMKTGGSGVLSNEESGKTLTINELITLMMIKSDNTAANILIDNLGMENINTSIKKLGCTDTELNRKMMDSNAIEKGIENYTSVNDLCLTLEKLYNKKCIDEHYDNLMLEIMNKNENHTKIPKLLPDTVSIANKSGEYTGIENDAAIVTTDKGTYVLCITTSKGGSGSQINAINNTSLDIYNKFIE